MLRTRLKTGARKITAVRLSQETLDCLDKLRTLFHQKYPEASYPTLSAALELVLTKNLSWLEGRPERQAVELAHFESLYSKAVPKPGNEADPTELSAGASVDATSVTAESQVQ